MKNRRKPLLVVFAITVFLCFSLGLSGPAVGDITPFSQDVNDAIDDGLDYIRNNNLLTNQNDSTGLLLLALLEKRQSADFNAPIVGYTGLDPADQTLADTAAQILCDGFNFAGRAGQYAYTDGMTLMARHHWRARQPGRIDALGARGNRPGRGPPCGESVHGRCQLQLV